MDFDKVKQACLETQTDGLRPYLLFRCQSGDTFVSVPGAKSGTMDDHLKSAKRSDCEVIKVGSLGMEGTILVNLFEQNGRELMLELFLRAIRNILLADKGGRVDCS